jgi:hypothetical protein
MRKGEKSTLPQTQKVLYIEVTMGTSKFRSGRRLSLSNIKARTGDL